MTTREYKQASGEGEILWGGPLPDVPLPDKDGRHYALQAFINYLASLTFNMTGKEGKVIPFQIPRKNIFAEWPNNEELVDKGDDDFPRVGFETIEEKDDYPGLVSNEVEGTDDVFAPGTVLYLTSEHVEEMEMHIMCRSIAERRAVLSGLEMALNPVQEFLGLRFRLTSYFNAPCRITTETIQRVEDQDAIRGRRSLKVRMTLRVPNLFLVKLEQFNPTVIVDVAPENSEDGPVG